MLSFKYLSKTACLRSALLSMTDLALTIRLLGLKFPPQSAVELMETDNIVFIATRHFHSFYIIHNIANECLATKFII